MTEAEKGIERIDHKAAAEGRLSRAVDLANSSKGADGYIYIALAEAQVHAALAIAEGQERVAREIGQLRRQYEKSRKWKP